MRVRLTCIADTHAGSTVGLAPTGGIPHPEGMTISTTPTSEWLWGIYTAQLARESEAARQHDLRCLVFNGDIMDGGMHHGNIQLYHPHPSVEKWISGRIVDEAVAILEPDYIFIVLGTPSHVGANGSHEESVGKALAAEHGDKLQRPSEHRYGWGVLPMELAGVHLDIRHHGKLGRLPHTRESYQKRYAFDVWSSQALYGAQPAESWVAIRAHRHKYADSGPVAPHKRGVRLFSMPCFQLSTDWARKMAFEEAPDIGMLGLTLQDGQVRDVYPQVVYPKVEEPTWRP